MPKYWVWRILVPEVTAPGIDTKFQHMSFELTEEQIAAIEEQDSKVPTLYMPGNWGLVKG